MYNRRVWLNKVGKTYQGYIVAVEEKVVFGINTFITISNGCDSISFNMRVADSKEEYIDKLKLIRDELDKFINYLEGNDKELKEDAEGHELCFCNKCNSYLIDKNPQVGAKKYNINVACNKLKQFEKYNEKDEIEYFWGCPYCETDEYLKDL